MGTPTARPGPTALVLVLVLIAGAWAIIAGLVEGIELRSTGKTLHPPTPPQPEKKAALIMSGQQGLPSERASSPGRMVDARALWSGGAATAVVAALIALVGVLVSRWLLGIPVLAPRQDGAWGDASTAGYAIAAAVTALAATAVMHLLLIATPRPRLFFAWIIGLATVIAVTYPFGTTAPLPQKAATAVINLVLGVAIGSLVNGTAARVIRRRAVAGGYQPGYPPSALEN